MEAYQYLSEKDKSNFKLFYDNKIEELKESRTKCKTIKTMIENHYYSNDFMEEFLIKSEFNTLENFKANMNVLHKNIEDTLIVLLKKFSDKNLSEKKKIKMYMAFFDLCENKEKDFYENMYNLGKNINEIQDLFITNMPHINV